MELTVKALLETAAAEIGYREKNTNAQLDDPAANPGNKNWTKYARDLHDAGYYNGNKNGYAWCDVFVDWCFFAACGCDAKKAQAVQCQTGSLGAGCRHSARYYRKAERFSTEPMAGDQIFFGEEEAEQHTGIVEAVEDGVIHVIEGNVKNQVVRKKYSRASKKIVGYGHPHFDPEPEARPQEESREKLYVVVKGDTLSHIAKSYGTTVRLLAAYNGIENPDLIYPDQHIRIPNAAALQKDTDTMAKEVIQGKWGNGAERKKRLSDAGYDYAAIQKRVNERMRS